MKTFLMDALLGFIVIAPISLGFILLTMLIILSPSLVIGLLYAISLINLCAIFGAIIGVFKIHYKEKLNAKAN